MVVVILALLAGCVPSLIVFFWLRNYLNKEKALYKNNCDRMLVSGFLTTFPVVLFSGCTAILLNVSGVKSVHPVLYAALHTFITLALSEELFKYYMFRRKLKKIYGEHSWLELTVYSTIVGIGFGLLESIVYVLESNPVIMLIRGISIPHGGYAAIVGYFYGKSVKENKKGYAVLGVFISLLLHGLYDFSLSDEIETITDASGFIAVTLAVLDLVIIIALIIFIRKNKNNPKYTGPLGQEKDI
jgi:RsiW-degrading membrane proteinase PrsW (M82 family)